MDNENQNNLIQPTDSQFEPPTATSPQPLENENTNTPGEFYINTANNQVHFKRIVGVYIGSYIYIVSYIFKRQYGQLEWNNNLISLTLTDKHGISSGKKIFETTPDKVSEIKVYFARLSFKVDGQKYIFDFEQYHGQWMQRSSQIVTKRVQIDIGLQWWIDKFKSLNIKVSQKITTKRLFGAIGIIVLIFFFLFIILTPILHKSSSHPVNTTLSLHKSSPHPVNETLAPLVDSVPIFSFDADNAALNFGTSSSNSQKDCQTLQQDYNQSKDVSIPRDSIGQDYNLVLNVMNKTVTDCFSVVSSDFSQSSTAKYNNDLNSLENSSNNLTAAVNSQ